MSSHVRMRQGWRTQSPAKDRLGPQQPEEAEWAPLPGAFRGSMVPRRPAFPTSSFQNCGRRTLCCFSCLVRGDWYGRKPPGDWCRWKGGPVARSRRVWEEQHETATRGWGPSGQDLEITHRALDSRWRV